MASTWATSLGADGAGRRGFGQVKPVQESRRCMARGARNAKVSYRSSMSRGPSDSIKYSFADEQSSNDLSMKPNRGSGSSTKISSKAAVSSWESTIASNQTSVPSAGPGSLCTKQSRGRSITQRLSEIAEVSSTKRLYGRDIELKKLRDAWEEMLLARSHPRTSSLKEHLHALAAKGENLKPEPLVGRRLILLSGLSGTGKTALAESLRTPVLIGGGFFLHGKFAHQYRLSRDSGEPYAGVVSACRELCELVLGLYSPTHTTEGLNDDEGSSNNSRKYFRFTLDEFREKLDQEVGVDAAILTKVVPCLGQILKSEAASSDSIGYLEAQHQFKFAFRRFIRAVASFGPVVLTLDDTQWADAASMELLEVLMSDRENPSLMVIACYRTDDMYSSQPHIGSIKIIKEMSVNDKQLQVESMLVENLSVDHVNDLLVDLLSSTVSETMALAECVYKRTLGNVFFLIQFCTLLEELGLLKYDKGILKWTWDVHEVQQCTAASDNVVVLLINKMKRLPQLLEQVLPMMACLGSTFHISVFGLAFHQLGFNQVGVETLSSSVYNTSGESRARDIIVLCEQEGLIEACGTEGSYQWSHDKIQEAAFCLIDKDALQILKLELGGALFQWFEPPDLETNIFVVANLVNTDIPTPSAASKVDPLDAAKINLRAGVKAIETSAFEQAAGYLTKGVGLLPENHWQCQGALCLDLFSAAAESEYCVGHFDVMQKYCDEIIQQRHLSLLEKRRAYNVMIDAAIAEDRLNDALNLCEFILAQLGCRFPKRALRFHTANELKRAKSILECQTPETMSQLPAMSDVSNLWTMELLDKFTTVCYLEKSNLLPLAIFKGLRWTLKYGVSEYSSVVFALVGFTLTVYLHDYQGGVAYATRGIELLKQTKSARKVEARVMFIAHALVLHWSHLLNLSLKPLLSAYEYGMAIGDTENAARCIYFHIEFSFFAGSSLSALLAQCAYYAEQMREVKQLGTLSAHRAVWQCILNLSGKNSNSVLLTGDAMDQDQVLQGAKAVGSKHVIAVVRRLQMYAAFVFNDFELVYALIRETDMDHGWYEKMIPGTLSLCHLYAFTGLAMLSLYRKTRHCKYWKLGKKLAAKIKAWSIAGNPNFPHYDSLFDAEMETIRGRPHAADAHYDFAILYTERHKLTQDRALSHERFGDHFAKLGRVKEAKFHISEALRLYKEWGAHAKAKQLLKTCASMLGTPSEIELTPPL